MSRGLTPIEERAWERLEEGFMSPSVEYGHASLFDEALEGTGWFWRLSASGYLDCTDWRGPYATELEAVKACLEEHGEWEGLEEEEATL